MKTPTGPSLNQSIGLINAEHHVQNKKKCITIIQNNYLKNLREELLEEEDRDTNKNNSEIIYIAVETNGVRTKIMVDTGANISLINGIELDKIQEEGKKHILTLPISNIILVGAKRRQNKTV